VRRIYFLEEDDLENIYVNFYKSFVNIHLFVVKIICK